MKNPASEAETGLILDRSILFEGSCNQGVHLYYMKIPESQPVALIFFRMGLSGPYSHINRGKPSHDIQNMLVIHLLDICLIIEYQYPLNARMAVSVVYKGWIDGLPHRYPCQRPCGFKRMGMKWASLPSITMPHPRFTLVSMFLAYLKQNAVWSIRHPVFMAKSLPS